MRTDGLSRRGLALGAAALLAAPRIARAQAPVRLRDLLGREVSLPRPARRVLLAQGRHLLVLNLLHPDPTAIVAGLGNDLKRNGVNDYAALRRQWPALDGIPTLPDAQMGLPIELVLSMQPDLVILSRSLATRNDNSLSQMEGAGLPVAVVDFFVAPLRDTEPSLEILGRLLGREEQAGRFLAFYRERMQGVRQAMAGLDEAARQSVFMHAHAGGTPCCSSPGRGVYDDFIRLAGGVNIGAATIPTPTGQLNLEYVLTRDARHYIATGGPYGEAGGVRMGAEVTPAEARRTLAGVIEREKLGQLTAIREGRAHAMWHPFNDSPMHLPAVECMARWLQPDRAAGLDPDATLAAMNERFAAAPMDGTYWVDLKG